MGTSVSTSLNNVSFSADGSSNAIHAGAGGQWVLSVQGDMGGGTLKIEASLATDSDNPDWGDLEDSTGANVEVSGVSGTGNVRGIEMSCPRCLLRMTLTGATSPSCNATLTRIA